MLLLRAVTATLLAPASGSLQSALCVEEWVLVLLLRLLVDAVVVLHYTAQRLWVQVLVVALLSVGRLPCPRPQFLAALSALCVEDWVLVSMFMT